MVRAPRRLGKLVASVVRRVEVEHDTDDGEFRFIHPLQKRLDSLGGVAVNYVDNGDLWVRTLANGVFNLMKVIATSHIKGTGQPIHTNPDEISQGFESKQAVSVNMHVEETNPFRLRNRIFKRVICVVPEHGFPTAEVKIAEPSAPRILHRGDQLIPGHIGTASIGDVATKTGKVTTVRYRDAVDERFRALQHHKAPHVRRVEKEADSIGFCETYGYLLAPHLWAGIVILVHQAWILQLRNCGRLTG